MKGQTVIIILLVLIVAKLYPSLWDIADPIFLVLFVVLAIAFVFIGCLWVIGFLGDRIKNRDKRKADKMELKSISKTLKDIDYMQQRIKKLK